MTIIYNSALEFVGLGGAEWLIVAAIIIALIFGFKKIPQLARSFGRASGEFQKAKIEMHKEIERVRHTDTSARDKLESVAAKLGIDTTNKTDEELRLAIDRILSKNSE